MLSRFKAEAARASRCRRSSDWRSRANSSGRNSKATLRPSLRRSCPGRADEGVRPYMKTITGGQLSFLSSPNHREGRDWTAAESACRNAIELNPSYALAHRMLGIVLSHLRRNEEAGAAAKRARELDPLNVTHRALSAQIAFAARDYSGAVQFAQQAIAIDPEFWIGYFQLGQAHEQLGSTDLALEALIKAARLSGGNSKAIALRGYVLAKVGKAEAAREMLSTLEAASHDRYVPPYAMALVHTGLCENDLALQYLERAYDVHDVHLSFLAYDPKWNVFCAEPRFIDVLSRCAFAKPAVVAPPNRQNLAGIRGRLAQN